MKESYTKPITKIDEFKTIDVITTSFNDVGADDNIVDGSNPDDW